MSHRTTKQSRRTWKERALCLLLSAVMLFGMLPGLTQSASAHWADQYLDLLVDWGVMRADQIGRPNDAITRAEFMAVINRAYGYTEMGAIPFTDVQRSDWFYDDVCIAYTAGYMKGTSKTTVSPNEKLTREMAVCILARNLMMKETPGESLAFSDARNIGGWARGLIKTAVENYIITGYSDGSFRPKGDVTLGEMAALVTRCVGTPIHEKGDYSMGGVFGNLTITSSDVTLRDTTVSGDLYISGGVGLGGVKLENVNVLGRIIVSGTGESEQGDASVVMRNVTANEMLVDNMRKGYVTVRAEGLTEIGETTVRTNAYLEDNTPKENGLKLILMDGAAGTRLDLAGRLKEVKARTPRSTIQLAKGSLQKLTVDEAATGSTVQIDRNTEIKELNLDVATTVNGQGDVEKLNINAAGSTVTMLPDDIYIRPGLTASIAGENMDAAAAEEASLDPRILSGYPVAGDVAPTSLRADFAGNKRGTIYWAVSNITDGSISADDLISPPSYGSLAVRNGSVATPSADTVVPVQITGLTSAGSYYLSAVLMDNRGQRSPVKVIAFTTPDNSRPAFATGYPYMSLITDTLAQATVMATKSCKLYYAVLPQGAQAPTTNELRSASVTGNLGYGVIDVTKNTEHTFTVSRQLEEKKNYVLYLWLSDADGVNSSAVQRVQFTTVDKTPPEFVIDPYVNQILATSVRLAGTLNEAGTVYWAVVGHGTAYPKPQPGSGDTTAPLDSEYAKLQVSAGMNCSRSGSVNVRANTEFTINVTGLTAEKTYDLYYLARDTAGNYSLEVKTLEIHTQDTSGPVVKQYFTDYTGLDNTQNPLPSTDIVLEFSEDIASTADGYGGLSFLALAQGKRPADVAVWPGDPGTSHGNPKDVLVEALRQSIVLYQIQDGRGTPVGERTKENENDADLNWTVDYRNVKVTAGEDGKILVTFPNNSTQSALNLASGATYYFRFENLVDTAQEQNRINPHPLWYGAVGANQHQVPAFTTVFAQVNMTSPGVTGAPYKRNSAGEATKENDYIDLSFRLDPDSTAKVEADNRYDILLYTDTVSRYNLYYRILDAKSKQVVKNPDETYLLPSKNKTQDDNGWYYLGDSGDVNPSDGWSGRSVNRNFNGCNTANFPQVNHLSENYTYEFVISLTQYGTSSVRNAWNGQINFEVHVIAGISNSLYQLSTNPSKVNFEDFLKKGLENNGGVTIGINRTQNYLPLRGSFIDSQLPKFDAGYPKFEPGDSFVNMQLNLTRDGTIYYVIAEDRVLAPVLDPSVANVWDAIPEDGKKFEEIYGSNGSLKVTSPVSGNIFNPRPYRSTAICGSVSYPGGGLTLPELVDRNHGGSLKPNTKYYVYFVLKGVSDELSPVYAFKFETGDTEKPKIELDPKVTGAVNVKMQVPAVTAYRLFTSIQGKDIALLKGNLSSNLGTDKTLPSEYASKTVLQALIETYSYNNASKGNTVTGAYMPVGYDGYSIFDVYASDSLKEQIGLLIRQGNYAGSAATIDARQDITITNTTAGQDVKLENMKSQTPYLFLTVAYHTSSERIVGDSFKAVDGVYILDPDAPEFIGCTTDARWTLGTSGVIDNQTVVNGTVTINFNKDLYWVSSAVGGTAGTQKIVDQKDTDGTNSVGIAYTQHTDPGSGKISVPNSLSGPRQTFTIKFKDMRIGSSITLFADGLIANADGQTTSKKLILTLTYDKLPSQSSINLYDVYFTAKWG